MADENKPKKKRGFLKTLFTMGAVGTALVAGGLLLAPFFTASAGTAAAVAGGVGSATPWQIYSSFYTPLFTNAATGNVGIIPGLVNMGNGISAWFQAVWATGAGIIEGMSYGDSFLEAGYEAINSPIGDNI